MTALIIGVLILITVVVAIIAFLLGVYFHRVFTSNSCKKTPQPPSPEPDYDDIIVLNPIATSNRTETTPNRVYDTIHDNNNDIELSTNEAYNITQHRDTSQRVEN